jgi:hypothetical protein
LEVGSDLGCRLLDIDRRSASQRRSEDVRAEVSVRERDRTSGAGVEE